MSLEKCLRLSVLPALVGGAVAGHAQSASVSVPVPPGTPPAPPAPLSATEEWIKELKNPSPWLSWGADMRIRDEYYDSAVSLANSDPRSEQNVIRFRGRLWTAITPVTNLTANVRLASEVREWTRPAFTKPYVGQSGAEWRYGIVDNANIKWGNVFGAPLTITAGRQDILFGDFWNWWLVADGTPGDGSWTYFLDAARVTLDAKDIKTKFDLVYIDQNADADQWMPTLNAHQDNYPLTDQDERGAIFYASNKSINNTTVDGYFMYKHDTRYSSRYLPTGSGDNADIYTLGGRLSGLPADHWQYSLEGAYQFGWKEDTFFATGTKLINSELDAFGGNARLSYLCRDSMNDQFHLVFEYLSGDNPDTANDEMFDVLWGRWPRYSELYLYSYARETNGRIGQHNNLMRVGGGWTASPLKNLSVGAYYNAMFAPESVATRRTSGTLFSNDGDFRGHYAQATVQYTFSRHVKAHLWAEAVWEGDYYKSTDLMSFLRAEMLFTF
jgi:hypothetical protein